MAVPLVTREMLQPKKKTFLQKHTCFGTAYFISLAIRFIWLYMAINSTFEWSSLYERAVGREQKERAFHNFLEHVKSTTILSTFVIVGISTNMFIIMVFVEKKIKHGYRYLYSCVLAEIVEVIAEICSIVNCSPMYIVFGFLATTVAWAVITLALYCAGVNEDKEERQDERDE